MEKAFGRSNSLVDLAKEIDFNDVTSECTKISTGIISIYLNALVLSLDLACVDVLEANFLGYKVAGPDSNSVIVDGNELVVGVVEEFDLVSDIHADVVATDSLSGLNLF